MHLVSVDWLIDWLINQVCHQIWPHPFCDPSIGLGTVGTVVCLNLEASLTEMVQWVWSQPSMIGGRFEATNLHHFLLRTENQKWMTAACMVLMGTFFSPAMDFFNTKQSKMASSWIPRSLALQYDSFLRFQLVFFPLCSCRFNVFETSCLCRSP